MYHKKPSLNLSQKKIYEFGNIELVKASRPSPPFRSRINSLSHASAPFLSPPITFTCTRLYHTAACLPAQPHRRCAGDGSRWMVVGHF